MQPFTFILFSGESYCSAAVGKIISTIYFYIRWRGHDGAGRGGAGRGEAVSTETYLTCAVRRCVYGVTAPWKIYLQGIYAGADPEGVSRTPF